MRQTNDSPAVLLVVPLVVSVLISTVVGITTFLYPLARFSFDYVWAAFYTLSIFGVAALWWMKQNCLLFRLVVSTVGLFFFAVVVFSDNGPALLALAWFVILAAALGQKLLDWLGLPLHHKNLLEGLLFAEGLGMAALAGMTLLLAGARLLQPLLPLPERFFRLLHPVPVYLLLIGLTAIFLPGLWRALRPSAAEFRQRFSSLWQTGGSGLGTVSFALLVICGIAGLLLALAPSIRYDALSYHLSVPTRYIEARGMIPMLETWNSYWAHYAEMFYTLALLVAGQPLPGLMHYTFGLLTTGLVFTLGRRLGGNRTGAVAALLFFSLPIVNYEAGTAYIDLFQAFYTFGAVYAVVIWWQERRDSWLVVSGIMAGFALGIKISAVTVLGPLGILLAILLLATRRPFRCTLKGLILFGLPAVLVYAPWPVRDFLWTGNPIFPMYNHIFKSPLWTYGPSIFSLESKPWTSFWSLMLMPWELVINSRRYYWEAQRGMLAALPLLGLPWVFPWLKTLDVNVRRTALTLMALVTAAIILFFFTSPNARYMMPLYAMIAIFAALNVEALLKSPQIVRLQGWLLPLVLCIAMVYLLSTRLALTVRSLDIEERYPVNAALGLETPDAFLSRTLPVYETYQYLDRASGEHPKVLAIGTDYLYYTRARIFPYMLSSEAARLAGLELPFAETAAAIAEYRYDYLLVDWNGVRKLNLEELPVLDINFLNEYAEVAYANHNVYAYRLLPAGKSQAGESSLPSALTEEVNLLGNTGFEEGNDDLSFLWEQNGNPTVDIQGVQAHQGQAAVQVTGSDFLFQQSPVEPGKLYSLGYWMRAEIPDQEARLQIMWRDRNLITVDVAAYTVTTGSDWTWWQISDVAPETAAYARVYVTAEDGSQVWVDDVVFTQGEISDQQRGIQK